MEDSSVFGVPRRWWVVIQASWFAVGVGLASLHTWKSHDADAISLGLIVFAFAGLLAPAVSEISVGSNSIRFQQVTQAASTATSDLETVLTKQIILTRNWLSMALRVRGVRRMDVQRSEYIAFARRQCTGAIADASQWLVPADDAVRVSLWLPAPDLGPNSLAFSLGNILDVERRIFADDAFTTSDTDYIGEAWRNARIVNTADAPEDWRAYNGGDAGPIFHGIMFVPIDWEGKRWGLLEVDRRQAERFTANAEAIAAALGNLMALLLADEPVLELQSREPAKSDSGAGDSVTPIGDPADSTLSPTTAVAGAITSPSGDTVDQAKEETT